MVTLWYVRARRGISSASAVGLVMLAPFIALLVQGYASVTNKAPAATPVAAAVTHPYALWAFVAFGIALGIAFVQTWEKYRRGKYDPTWALKYQEIFAKMWDETEDRQKAAWALLHYRNDLANLESEETRGKLAPIDEVLDVFEDIALYTEGDQISPEAAHHHFYHWLRGYYDAAHPYICAARRKERQKWARLKWLRKVTDAVERGGIWNPVPGTLSPEECSEFLAEELEGWTPKTVEE